MITNKTIAKLLTVVSALLILVGLLLPPMGVIDNSVLIAVGELIAVKALFLAWDKVDQGQGITFRHGNTTVTLGDDGDGDHE